MGVSNIIGKLEKEWATSIGRDFSYVITTNPIIVESGKRANAKELPYTINHLVRIKDVSLFLKNRKLNNLFLAPAISLLKSIPKIKRKRINLNHEFVIEEKKFDSDINKFWEKARSQYNFVVEKTYEHLTWRYQPALGEYKILQAVKDGEILGFAVVEMKREENYQEGYITDL